MPLESGGRADKYGNKYETEFVISQLLNLYEEEISGLIYEPLGEDESGVDIVIYHNNNTKELAQCKIRNGSKDYWTIGDLNSKNILKKWQLHLDNSMDNIVSLVSPLPATGLQDMITRAMTNNDPKLFYDYQIKTAGSKFQKEFSTFCRIMELNVENPVDLSRAVNYLRRIKIVDFPDNSTTNLQYQVHRLFVGNRDEIYNQFYSAIHNKDMYGRRINIADFNSFLNKKAIYPKKLAYDSRIIPHINRLNREFEDDTNLINGDLIEREAFKEVYQSIEKNESVILHGSAGNGKTVAAFTAIEYCKKKEIPYLAIKLDKNPPENSTEEWAEGLGLPDSISLCLDSISKDSPVVLILDQLDSLRWTQSHSSKSLEVCKEIIYEIENINRTRDKKINLIFVCRSYDLNNDSQIKQLFEDKDSEWSKIKIDKLSDEELKLVTGEAYHSLTSKTKELLKTPSNLFFWNQITDSKGYSTEYSSTYDLVEAWWTNIESNWRKLGKNENEIITFRDQLVRLIDRTGRQYIPKNLLKKHGLETLEYLSSQNFINVQQNKVSFIHQSIYDSFVADAMIEKYFEHQSVSNILGSKEKQTPSSKYQVQLFLEYLLEFDIYDFLNVGQGIYESDSIRFFIKYTFLEILSEMKGSQIDNEISNFVLRKVNDLDYHKYLVQDVFYGHSEYVSLLIKEGVFNEWLKDEKSKYTVLNLVASIYPDYSEDVVNYLEEIISNDEDLANEFSRYFSWDYEQDTDSFFEFRLRFAKKYPEQVTRQYFDFESAFDKKEVRTIRIIRFLYENQDKNTNKNYDDGYLNGLKNKDVKNYEAVLKYLLPIIPNSTSKFEIDMDWIVSGTRTVTIERTIISLIKKANIALIENSQKEFFDKYNQYFGAKNIIYNEILLDAFYYMDENYSEKIIEYLFENIDYNLFDDSSAEQNSLTLGKKVIAKHSDYISKELFQRIEHVIISYKPTDLVRNYKDSVKYRRTTNKWMFRSFWGDFQFELLNALPKSRLSNKSKELLSVLERKYPDGTSKYIRYYPSLGGFVTTEISNKELGINQWKKILMDDRLEEKLKASKSKWNTNSVVENSLFGFANDFRAAVSKSPIEFIELYLNLKQSNSNINISFERSFFGGLEQSEMLNQISTELIEELIHDKTIDSDVEILKDICGIISKLGERKWSTNIIYLILELASKHENPQRYNDKMIMSSDENEDLTYENLINNYYNSVRGVATDALIATFRTDDILLKEYREIAETKLESNNLVDQYGALNIFISMFNDNKEWAGEHITNLFKNNIILFGHHLSKDLAHIIYRFNKKSILDIIVQAYRSSYQQSVKNASYTLSEFYIRYGEFENYFSEDLLLQYSEDQINALQEMLTVYLGIYEYKEIARKTLLLLLDLNLFNTNFIFNIFHKGNLDAKEDAELIVKVIEYDASGRTYYNFTGFLQESDASLIDYNHIIIESSRNLIQNTIETKEYDIWGISKYLPTLVIHLYDEVADIPTQEKIAQECLNIWDDMYKYQIGNTRSMSKDIMDR